MAESPSDVDRPQLEELETMAAYPNLDSHNWALANLCDRLWNRVERETTGTISRYTSFQQAMSLILAKSHDDARAVIRLSKSGYGVQAAALSRSLIEAAINSGYIELKPEDHGRAFIKSLQDSNQRLAKRMKPHASTDEVRNLIKTAEDIQTESGWPRTLSQRAEFLPSRTTCMMWLILWSRSSFTQTLPRCRTTVGRTHGQFNLQIGLVMEWVAQALATCFIALHEWPGWPSRRSGSKKVS